MTAAETDVSVMDASPDGRSIIIGSVKEESNIWRVAVRDGKELSLIRDLDAKLFPALSPDGQRISAVPASPAVPSPKWARLSFDEI